MDEARPPRSLMDLPNEVGTRHKFTGAENSFQMLSEVIEKIGRLGLPYVNRRLALVEADKQEHLQATVSRAAGPSSSKLFRGDTQMVMVNFRRTRTGELFDTAVGVEGTRAYFFENDPIDQQPPVLRPFFAAIASELHFG